MTDWRVKLQLLKNCSYPRNIPQHGNKKENSKNKLEDHLHRLNVVKDYEKVERNQTLKTVIDANLPSNLRYQCYLREVKNQHKVLESPSDI